MATKLDFQKIERNGGAIQFNEWASAPRAEIVNRACDQFLASACFSLDKNGGIRRGDALDLFEYRFQSRTATYDLLESARISSLVGGSESCNSCHERPPYATRCPLLLAGLAFQSRPHTLEQRFVVERLCHELHSACAQRLHPHFFLSIRCDNFVLNLSPFDFPIRFHFVSA